MDFADLREKVKQSGDAVAFASREIRQQIPHTNKNFYSDFTIAEAYDCVTTGEMRRSLLQSQQNYIEVIGKYLTRYFAVCFFLKMSSESDYNFNK